MKILGGLCAGALCVLIQVVALAAPVANVVNADLHALWTSEDGALVLAAGADSTLRRSIDGGRSWAQVALPEDFSVSRIADDRHGNFLALGAQGLLHSSDAGQHWMHAVMPAGRSVSAMRFDARRGTWFASSAQGGLLRSGDGGRHWQVLPGVPDLPMLDLAITASGGLLAGGGHGQILFSSSGSRWQQLDAGLDAVIVRLLALPGRQGSLAFWSEGSVSRISVDGRTISRVSAIGEAPPSVAIHDARHAQVIVGTPLGEILRSGDAGRSWQRSVVVENIYLTGLHADARDGALTVVGGRGTIARSTDAGASWTVLNGNAWTSRLHALAASADGKHLYAGGTGGLLLRSDDQGRHWTLLQADLHRYVSELLGLPGSDTLFAAGMDGLLIRSDDSGKQWRDVQTGLRTNVSLQSLVRDSRDGRLLASGPMASFLLADARGEHWTAVQQLADAGEGFFRDVVAGLGSTTLLLVGNPGQIMRSVDGGHDWRPTDADTAAPGVEHVFAVAEGVFVAVRADGRILRSKDDGQHWVEAGNAGVPASAAFSDVGHGLLWIMGQGRLLRSSDQGLSWQALEMPGVRLNAMLRTAQGSLLGFGNAGLILRSTDDGRNWQAADSGVASALRKPVQDATGARIYVPGRDGVILGSTDDGQHWTRLPTGTRAHLNRLWLSADGKILVASGERLIRIALD